MFLLASDFDRTFYINNYDFKKNVDALGGFMKDNLFVIVTGRSYQDYMNITKNYVPVNYLVLNHGATVLKDDKVIRSVCIDNKIKDELKKLFDFDNIEYFATKDKLSRVSINEDDLSKINISMKDNLVAKKAVEYINSHCFIRISLKLYQVRRISATHLSILVLLLALIEIIFTQ